MTGLADRALWWLDVPFQNTCALILTYPTTLHVTWYSIRIFQATTSCFTAASSSQISKATS
jgi:hypothetical protein